MLFFPLTGVKEVAMLRSGSRQSHIKKHEFSLLSGVRTVCTRLKKAQNMRGRFYATDETPVKPLPKKSGFPALKRSLNRRTMLLRLSFPCAYASPLKWRLS